MDPLLTSMPGRLNTTLQRYNAYITDAVQERQQLTMADVAVRAGLSYNSVRSYMHRGSIADPDGYVARSPWWTPETIDRWLAERPGRGKPTGTPKRSGPSRPPISAPVEPDSKLKLLAEGGEDGLYLFAAGHRSDGLLLTGVLDTRTRKNRPKPVLHPCYPLSDKSHPDRNKWWYRSRTPAKKVNQLLDQAVEARAPKPVLAVRYDDAYKLDGGLDGLGRRLDTIFDVTHNWVGATAPRRDGGSWLPYRGNDTAAIVAAARAASWHDFVTDPPSFKPRPPSSEPTKKDLEEARAYLDRNPPDRSRMMAILSEAID